MCLWGNLICPSTLSGAHGCLMEWVDTAWCRVDCRVENPHGVLSIAYRGASVWMPCRNESTRHHTLSTRSTALCKFFGFPVTNAAGFRNVLFKCSQRSGVPVTNAAGVQNVSESLVSNAARIRLAFQMQPAFRIFPNAGSKCSQDPTRFSNAARFRRTRSPNGASVQA